MSRKIASVLLCVCLFGASVHAALNTGSENVTGNRSTPKYTVDGTDYGPYGWDIKYQRAFDGTKFTKHLELEFNFIGLNYNDDQKKAYRDKAEQGIESVWNGKFSVKDDSTGTLYPCTLDITTAGPFDVTVNVRQKQGASDPPYNRVNWYVDEDTAPGQAHEVGHMLGLFDEYIGGAVDKYPNPTVTDTGVMGLGANLANPDMFHRYYQQYLDYMKTLNPTGTFSLVMVPEPFAATFALLGITLLARSRRQAA